MSVTTTVKNPHPQNISLSYILPAPAKLTRWALAMNNTQRQRVSVEHPTPTRQHRQVMLLNAFDDDVAADVTPKRFWQQRGSQRHP